jgi:hypothetical protein
MRLHLDLNAMPAANNSEDFVADFRGSESSLEVQSASTHGEVVAVAPLSDSSLELQLVYSRREVPVARGVDINTVTAERNFVVQLYETAGSKISLELQLASSHTHQELVVAADVDIHPVAAAAETNFLVQPHEVAESESSLKAV